jgi:hypothetical protein
MFAGGRVKAAARPEPPLIHNIALYHDSLLYALVALPRCVSIVLWAFIIAVLGVRLDTLRLERRCVDSRLPNRRSWPTHVAARTPVS